MATIDSPEIVREMLRNDGVYQDDPQVYAIAQYTNASGKAAWSICYNQLAFNSLYNSPYCTDIVVFWIEESGITKEGKQFLEKEDE